MAEALAYNDELRNTAHYLYSGALQSVETATTLRIQSGRVLRTDGPFAEAKEHVGGFIVIEARDHEEAVRLASKIPPLRWAASRSVPSRNSNPGVTERQITLALVSFICRA